jgi:hypothetical protein
MSTVTSNARSLPPVNLSFIPMSTFFRRVEIRWIPTPGA